MYRGKRLYNITIEITDNVYGNGYDIKCANILSGKEWNISRVNCDISDILIPIEQMDFVIKSTLESIAGGLNLTLTENDKKLIIDCCFDTETYTKKIIKLCEISKTENCVIYEFRTNDLSNDFIGYGAFLRYRSCRDNSLRYATLYYGNNEKEAHKRIDEFMSFLYSFNPSVYFRHVELPTSYNPYNPSFNHVSPFQYGLKPYLQLGLSPFGLSQFPLMPPKFDK